MPLRLLCLVAVVAAVGCMPGVSAGPPTMPAEPQVTGPTPPGRLTGPPISRERSPALDRALAANSSAALVMFLIAHPGDPFAEQARTYLRARRLPDSPAMVQAAAGAQAPAVAAFDAARLAGTAEAWNRFLARYAGHPLAAEAAHFR